MISLNPFWFKVRFKFNAMIKFSMRWGNSLRGFFRENIGEEVMEIRGNDLFRGFGGSLEIFF